MEVLGRCVCGCGRGVVWVQTWQTVGRAQEAAGSAGARPRPTERPRGGLLQQWAAVVTVCRDGRQYSRPNLQGFPGPCSALGGVGATGVGLEGPLVRSRGEGSPGEEVNRGPKNSLDLVSAEKNQNTGTAAGRAPTAGLGRGRGGPGAACLSQGEDVPTSQAGGPGLASGSSDLGGFLRSLIGMVTARRLSRRHCGLSRAAASLTEPVDEAGGAPGRTLGLETPGAPRPVAGR